MQRAASCRVDKKEPKLCWPKMPMRLGVLVTVPDLTDDVRGKTNERMATETLGGTLLPGLSSCHWQITPARFQFAVPSQSKPSRTCDKKVDVQGLCALLTATEKHAVNCKLRCSCYEAGDYLAPGGFRYALYKAMLREEEKQKSNRPPERPSARIIRACPARRDSTGQSRCRRRRLFPALWASSPCPTRPACPSLSHRC